MRACALLSLLLLAFAAHAELRLTPREREAFEYLRTAERLETPSFGIAGLPSYGFVALRILSRSRDADAAYKELIHSGTMPGQLYGLIGVYRSDPLFFATAVRPYVDRPGEILVSEGCVIGKQDIAPIVRRRDGQLDIAGGGYTEWFLERDFEEWEQEVRKAERTYDFSRAKP